MDIGTIKTITLNDNSLECVVDFGADDVDPKCVLYCGANRTEYPLPGDEVVVDRDGAESVIVGLFTPISDLDSGESILSGRNIDGIVVSSVKVANDGTVKVNEGKSGKIEAGTASDFVAMAAKVDSFISGVDEVLRSWTVAPQDGGLALQDAYKLKFLTAPASVASSNIKGD
jgi:hypothetical protein